MTNNSRKVVVHVRLKPGVLDPQGITIHKALLNMGYHDVESVRSGRFFELEIRSEASAMPQLINEVCTKLLANPVIEDFAIEEIA
ncbi:MAG TPA: phosphoribosylformylglycinamidine synthase subunit PurS [Candidatus Deferrimicrobium sp.]|nr:phosphoribosylformylglycinamidine synthase subunit PurS [Candidatus Deferrimicrobium sp.]